MAAVLRDQMQVLALARYSYLDYSGTVLVDLCAEKAERVRNAPRKPRPPNRPPVATVPAIKTRVPAWQPDEKW